MENKEINAESVDTKQAYMMVQINFKSLEEATQRYAQFAIPSLQKYGGQMIAGTPTPRVKEGKWVGNWAAILRFPSMEAAEGWYNSEEYKPLKELRINELQAEEGRILMLEEM